LDAFFFLIVFTPHCSTAVKTKIKSREKEKREENSFSLPHFSPSLSHFSPSLSLVSSGFTAEIVVSKVNPGKGREREREREREKEKSTRAKWRVNGSGEEEENTKLVVEMRELPREPRQ